MPRSAPHAQRVAWHRAHQEACACRAVPLSLRDEVGLPPKPKAARKKV